MAIQRTTPPTLKTTVFELEDLVKRCFAELRRTDSLGTAKIRRKGMTDSDYIEQTADTILNEDEVCKHIAKTVIGELYELEICRKIGPMFRMMDQLTRDFAYLDAAQAKETALLGLRIGPIDR